MPEAPDRLIKALSDRYRIERELGQGGMATVFLAQDNRHDRKVAIKVLRQELAAVIGAERFLAEIRTTANLQHPHILPLFDSGQADSFLFYVMPYVEGESLRDRLRREQQLPIAEATRIAREIASALDYAHRHGVIHRDIKPENILLHDGQALVADFGIALAASKAGSGRMTETGMSLGTPHYMSPEQAMGEREITARSDVYALGAVTYEMLTGEPPFTGPNAQAIVAKVLTTDPGSLTEKRRSIPAHVEEAVLTALEKLPADRFSSAREFADSLERDTPTATSGRRTARAAAGGRGRAAFWRDRLRDPLTLGLAAVAAVLFGFSAWRNGRADSAGATVKFGLTLPPGTSIATSTQTILAISPDGGTLAFAGREPNGNQRIFVRMMNDPVARPLDGTNEAFNIFFSPDGNWIGFLAAGRMKKVRAVGGTVMTIADLPGIVGGATWSNRGEIIVSTGGAGLLHVFPENGGTGRRLCTKQDGPRALFESGPHALGDGNTVLYTSYANQGITAGRLAVGSLDTGECTVLDLPALQPLGIVAGMVVYVTDAGAIMAAPMDVRRRRLTGLPQPLISDVDANQTTGAAQAALSASGTLVYQSGSPASQLVLADFRGVTQPVLEIAQRFSYPRYSPDGRRIAVSISAGGQRDVWILDRESGTSTRLTVDGALNERPEWSPDGTRVLYRTSKDRRSAIWWRPVDLSGLAAPLLASLAEDYYEGVITPDGSAIVYQLDTAGADVMYRMLSGDTTKRPISNTEFTEAMPRISPDGRWVAYVTTESGTDQVVVSPFPGPGARVQVSVNGGREPVWSRDGRRLFYRDNQTFVLADVSTNPGFSVRSREVLFRDSFITGPLPHANYDVAPDGAHLLLLRPTEEAQVIIAHNWINDLLAMSRSNAGR